MKEVYIAREKETSFVPIWNLRMISDDEWNALAYRNWLERRCCA